MRELPELAMIVPALLARDRSVPVAGRGDEGERSKHSNLPCPGADKRSGRDSRGAPGPERELTRALARRRPSIR